MKAVEKRTAAGEDAIRGVIERLHAALRAKDAAGAVADYDPHNVMFVLAPPLEFTENNRPGTPGVEEWLAQWDGPLGYEYENLRVVADERVGFSHALCHMFGKKKTGEDVDMWFRETMCFTRDAGGAWKIAHQHQSVPFYMDGSMRAAVDLKPE